MDSDMCLMVLLAEPNGLTAKSRSSCSSSESHRCRLRRPFRLPLPDCPAADVRPRAGLMLGGVCGSTTTTSSSSPAAARAGLVETPGGCPQRSISDRPLPGCRSHNDAVPGRRIRLSRLGSSGGSSPSSEDDESFSGLRRFSRPILPTWKRSDAAHNQSEWECLSSSRAANPLLPP
jgi:hypothetical protein